MAVIVSRSPSLMRSFDQAFKSRLECVGHSKQLRLVYERSKDMALAL